MNTKQQLIWWHNLALFHFWLVSLYFLWGTLTDRVKKLTARGTKIEWMVGWIESRGMAVRRGPFFATWILLVHIRRPRPRSNVTLLFSYGQSSHRVASSIWHIPRDDLSTRKSNGTLHEWSKVVKDFTPECGGINRGKTEVFPRLIPTHERSETFATGQRRV